MLSAISAKGELRFMTSRKRLSAALFIEFLRRLITNYPKKIFLVVDGLPAHKAKSVHRFVHQVKDRLRLFFLPPYSPEINPDELVWNDVKNHGVARTLIRAPEITNSRPLPSTDQRTFKIVPQRLLSINAVNSWPGMFDAWGFVQGAYLGNAA